jgi:phage terminase large subunit
MKELEIKVSKVFSQNYNALHDPEIEVIVNQGGSRSGKTYSILQLLVLECITTPGRTIDIVRNSFSALRPVEDDLLTILSDCGFYDIKSHNRTTHTYTFPNSSRIKLYSTSEPQKLRGIKRDIVFINEANETSYDAYQQIRMRTTRKVILDFNPSDVDSWVYDLLKEETTVLIKSTYKDNPFLPDLQKKYFENLKDIDPNYYRTYTLGERPTHSVRIYSHFKSFKNYPAKIDETVFGLDLGFSHATALVRVDRSEDEYFIKELIYESNLTSEDLIRKMQTIPDMKKHIIYVDTARPEIIESLKRAGFKATGAVKDVKAGIDFVRSKPIRVHEDSLNIWNEYKKYSWKTVNERQTDEPIKLFDDALDSIRYAIYSSQKKQANPGYFKFY